MAAKPTGTGKFRASSRNLLRKPPAARHTKKSFPRLAGRVIAYLFLFAAFRTDSAPILASASPALLSCDRCAGPELHRPQGE
jgi:hypothetical protein